MNRLATDFIVVHCSATRPSQHWRAADIDELHRAKGWAGIGYHLVICRDGVVEFGRPFLAQGAHVAGFNQRTFGLCLIGGLLENGEPGKTFSNTFTTVQEVSLIETVRFLWRAWPNTPVVGHRDLSPDHNGDGIIDSRDWLKQCPTFNVRQWIEENVL